MIVLDNVEISYWLTDWCKEADIKAEEVLFYIDRENLKLNICTSRPGLLIGLRGARYEEYKNRLKALENGRGCKEQLTINLIECTQANFWVDYNYMGEGF